jgi:cytochrome o ubiquinol oxidase subunit IV
MTDIPTDTARGATGDVAPGYGASAREQAESSPAGILSYVIGLALSILLTVASFWVVHTGLIYAPGIVSALVTLAIAQMGIHLVFFLHITTAPDNTNNVLALAFGLMIVGFVLLGSLWIMTHLNHLHIAMEQMPEMRR